MNKKKLKLTEVLMFTALILFLNVYPLQSAIAGVVLWNKLGSDTEISQSAVGPNGVKSGGSFTPGPFPSFGQAFVNNALNSYLLTFPADLIISKSRGTMMFWAKLINFPTTMPSTGGPTLFAAVPTNTFMFRMGFGGNDGCGGGGLWGSFGVGVGTPSACTGFVDTATQAYWSGSDQYDTILGDHTVWHHYAIVWDEIGISQLGGKKVYIYLDGNLVATPFYNNQSPWGAVPSGSRFALAYLNNYSGTLTGSIAVDNLVVYDYVKTDFSDRFNENPLFLLAPTLHAITLSPSGIQLSWNNLSGVKGYRIQRKLGNCASTNPWATLLDVNANTLATENSALTANTAYAYQIASYYGGQSFSPYSNCASATTGIAGTSHAPASVAAVSKSDSTVALAWDDSSANETSFAIYRKVGAGMWTLLKTTAANIQKYSDTSATGNISTTSYAYDVRACNAAGCSPANPSAVEVPFSPTNLAATVGTTVNLSWSDNSSNETNFQIQRKNGNCTSTTPWTVISSPVVVANRTSFSDGSAVSGETYSYHIRASQRTGMQPYVFSLGYSGISGCVSAIAP